MTNLDSYPEPLVGGCQCGQLRYRVNADAQRLNVCYCRDCQMQSGSAFGMSLIVAPEAVEVTQGQIKEFTTEADSGRRKTCVFCPECGVRLFNRTSALCSIKPGTLDEPIQSAPDGYYWRERRLSWLPVPGQPRFNHVGLPIQGVFEGEIDLPHLRLTVSDHQSNPFGIQWQRYWPDAPYPELVQTVPHVAFEVDDLEAAIADHEVIIAPNSPSAGVLVAFIKVQGAPVELMQIDRSVRDDL